MKRKVLSLIMAVAMILGTMTIGVFAAETDLPEAKLEKLAPMVLTTDDGYMTWPSGDSTVDRPLNVVVKFSAVDTEETVATSPYKGWYTDFYITFDGLKNGSFMADGCYLAGIYDPYPWIVIPTDGLEVEEGAVYPVVSAFDPQLTYEEICTGVKEMICAIYIKPEIIEANPDMTVTLNLGIKNGDDGEVVYVNSSVYNAKALAGVVEVTTYEELIAALAEDHANVIMMNDITATATQSNGYGKTGIVVEAGDVLDGNGKTLTINGANSTWDSAITMKGGEVKNLTIAGAMRGAFMPGANGDVVIDNCIFKDVIYTFNSDAGSKNYTVTIKNSALNGWTSFSNVHKSVTFENCTFGEGSGYAYCRPYQPTEFNGCDFGEDYGVDASQTAANSLVFNDCTYDGAPLSAGNGWQMFSGGSDVIIDGEEVHFIASDKTVASVGNTAYDNLQDALNAAVTAGKDVTVEILTDIDLSNIDWSPVSVNGSLNPAAHLVTVNGNNHTITNLNNMLFSGTWAGKSGLIINDLTIADSNIVNDKDDTAKTVGVGAFIGYPQASETITLNNCHLINSTVEGGHWTGGLIGMAGGYNGNDGPVFMNLTITGCSVKDSVITGKGSAGGLMGHASCAAWTKVVVENTVVSGNTITSTGSSNEKAGAVFGTVGAAGTAATADGETKTGGQFVAATVENNTVTSNGTSITTIYGRQGSETGKLELTGGTYDHKPISGEESWAGVKEGFVLETNSNGTYGVAPEVGVVWTTATDAGFYKENNAVKGMMRFLFHAGLDKTITASGIHYIDSADITEKVQVGETATGGATNAFHGDIVNIPEGRTGRYYAVGFVVADGKYYWSEPVECEPNFVKEFTGYTGGVE